MTTALDIINLAMKDAGVLGVGQTLLAEDANDALTRLNMLIAQWRRKRWIVWHLIDKSVTSTGAVSYTVGPSGNINVASRPDRLEAAYFRMLPGVGSAGAVDYPLRILESREDYSKIALKTMTSFSQVIWYDSAWPMGAIYPWPVPQASLYEIHIVIKDNLVQFTDLNTAFTFPDEYLAAMHYCLAQRLRTAYRLPPDESINGLAKDALETIRMANIQVPALVMPNRLIRSGVYNIYSDQSK